MSVRAGNVQYNMYTQLQSGVFSLIINNAFYYLGTNTLSDPYAQVVIVANAYN